MCAFKGVGVSTKTISRKYTKCTPASSWSVKVLYSTNSSNCSVKESEKGSDRIKAQEVVETEHASENLCLREEKKTNSNVIKVYSTYAKIPKMKFIFEMDAVDLCLGDRYGWRVAKVSDKSRFRDEAWDEILGVYSDTCKWTPFSTFDRKKLRAIVREKYSSVWENNQQSIRGTDLLFWVSESKTWKCTTLAQFAATEWRQIIYNGTHVNRSTGAEKYEKLVTNWSQFVLDAPNCGPIVARRLETINNIVSLRPETSKRGHHQWSILNDFTCDELMKYIGFLKRALNASADHVFPDGTSVGDFMARYFVVHYFELLKTWLQNKRRKRCKIGTVSEE